MDKRVRLTSYAILLLLWGCLRCTPQPEPVVHVTNSDSTADWAAITPELTETRKPTNSPLVSTQTPTPISVAPSPTHGPGDLAQLLPREAETQVYILTTTSLSLSNDQTTHKLWQYTLSDGSYKILASWPAFSETSLADSAPEKVRPTIADILSVDQDELTDLKEQLNPLKISFSPTGRYLAVVVSTFACCLDYISSWPIKNSTFLMDLETGQVIDVRVAWGAPEGWTADLLWSPDGNKLAVVILRPGYIYDLYVYELLSFQLEHIGRGEQAVWHSDSRHLSFVSFDDSLGAFRLTTIDTESQETKTLDLSQVQWLPYTTIDSSGTILIFHQDRGKAYHTVSRLDPESESLHPLAQVNDRNLSSPQGNSNGPLIAYESWPNSKDRSLQIFDLRTNEVCTILDMPVSAWEWSDATNAILARVPGEQSGKSQAVVVLVEDRIVITLPEPPNLGEYESITDVTW